MNKRITSLLLSVVMICSLLVSAVPAWAAAGDSGVTASVSQASPGDTFSVTLKVPGTTKQISDMSLKVLFDNAVFEVTEYTIPSIEGMSKMQSTVTEANSNSFFSATYDSESSDADITFAGIELTAKFRVKDGAAFGESVFKLDESVGVGSLDELGLPDILMKLEDFTNKSATIKIVSAPKPATGITLNKNNLSLVEGNSETLTATVEPINTTDTVVWSSDNALVAKVDNNGKVTGVAAGTAKITAKAGDKTATCNVTVEKAPCTHANKTTVPEKDSTCIEKGWDAYQKCGDCEKLFDMSDNEISVIPYLNLASHSYTKQDKTNEALKTAGTCKDEAVYYYSCSVCGDVEHNDAHTFNGEKDPTNHVGGTRIEGASEPDHKNQTPGSTGKTICNGCDAVLAAATEIQPGDHVAADVWSNDETNHWKECKEVGCGVVIDGSKAAHSSTGNNVATCQKKAVCDVCKVQYGALAAHKKADSFSSDSTGHWYACTTSGCTEKLEFAAHTPDHKGHATEEYAIKCTVCNYVIEAQLGHTHNFNQQNTDGKFKATDATCTKPATYYYSCTCGEKGTETFEYGSALDHTEGTAWEKDENYHWHICTVAGCGVVIESSKAEHSPDHEGGATYDYPVLCRVCGQVMEAQLENSDVRIEVPFKLTVAKTGEKDPSAEIFKFALSDFGAPVEIKIVTETVATDGAKTYEGSFVFTVKKSELGNLSEGFVLSQLKGDAEGWTYDETAYRVVPANGDEESISSFLFFKVDAEDGDNGSENVTFTNSYNAKADAPKPDDTSKKDTETSPKTGDNSMLTLWVALLFVSGAVLTGTTLYSRKKRTYNR